MRRYETPEVELLLYATEPIMAFGFDLGLGVFPGENSDEPFLPGEDNALPEDSFEKP